MNLLTHRTDPQIGQIVRILKGKDAGGIGVVVELLDDKFVRIADGNKRKFDQAKRKNIQHLEFQDLISSEVVNSLTESGRVTNGKLRYAVSTFVQFTETKAEEKGD